MTEYHKKKLSKQMSKTMRKHWKLVKLGLVERKPHGSSKKVKAKKLAKIATPQKVKLSLGNRVVVISGRDFKIKVYEQKELKHAVV